MSFKIPPKKRKAGRPRKAKPVGRPTIFKPEIIEKLEEVFRIGGTDTEACLHADISCAALYKFQNRYPEFIERKNKLKEALTLRARLNVAKALNDRDNPDIDISKWYLERKRRDEFAQKTHMEHSGNISNHLESLSDEELDALIDEEVEKGR